MFTSTFTVISAGSGFLKKTDAVYATARNAATASEKQDGFEGGLVQSETGFGIARVGCSFDSQNPTSGNAIPAGAIILGGFIRLIGRGTGSGNPDSDSIVIVSFTPADPTTLALADYDQFGSTPFATALPISSYNSTNLANNDITLNQAAFDFLKAFMGGKMALGVRMNTRDIGNTAPTGSNSIRFAGNTVLLSLDWIPNPGGFMDLI